MTPKDISRTDKKHWRVHVCLWQDEASDWVSQRTVHDTKNTTNNNKLEWAKLEILEWLRRFLRCAFTELCIWRQRTWVRERDWSPATHTHDTVSVHTTQDANDKCYTDIVRSTSQVKLCCLGCFGQTSTNNFPSVFLSLFIWFLCGNISIPDYRIHGASPHRCI